MRIGYFILLSVFFLPAVSFCQDNYDFYISNSGSNKSTGTSEQSPKQTIAASDTVFKKFAATHANVNVGLRSGDIFNDGLTTTYPIQLSTYYNNSGTNNFAILNGSDEFDTGWIKLQGTLNTYQQAINYTGFDGQPVGNYSYVYVIEIDKELEKTAPVTARKPLILAPSLKALDTIAGSFYEPLITGNQIPVYIHTSNGSSPGSSSKYRYEIAVRYSGIYGYSNNNNRFENLWIRGYGAGYGSIPSGENTYCNNIIFGPGAAEHHVVIESGIVNHSLFLRASKNANFYAVVFYGAYGLGYKNSISNSLFMDVMYPIYSHTSFPNNNYASLSLDSVIAFANTSIGGIFCNTSDNDSVIFNNVYEEGYSVGYSNNDAKFFSIANSYFKDATYGIKYSANPVKSIIDNAFIKASLTGISMQANNSMQISNSIIHMYSPASINLGVTFIGNSGYNHVSANGNIFISDEPGLYMYMATANTDNGIATSRDTWNNNVYIVLKGSRMSWRVTNRNTNNGASIITSFAEWQKQSGQDKNSLFFDLRNDSLGLKEIFIDPANGDYELANTVYANQIRALQAGMTNPITCFLQKPTYEQAVSMIMNHETLTINSCRNPCLETNIRVNYKFNPSILNNQQIQLQWDVAEQQNIDHFEIERAISDSNFTTIDSVAVTADSSYSFIDNDIQLNVLYNYRLAVIARDGNKCYSAIDSIRTVDNQHQVSIYPNPSPGNIKISVNGYTGPGSFVISNAIGQVILTGELNIQSGLSPSLNLAKNSKGLYFLRLQTIDGTYMQKFIID